MDKEVFLDAFMEAIRAIINRRYFSTERGYQAELYSQLRCRLKDIAQLEAGAIVEAEYQKSFTLHKLRIRPDLIVHVPREVRSDKDPSKDNFCVIEMKRKASKNDAEKDFSKLDQLFDTLNYKLGIFLNIDSANTFFDCYTGNYEERLHCFAVRLVKNKMVLKEEVNKWDLKAERM